MATFIGDYTCKVDVKGRIILPMGFKKQMPADAQDHFVVRKDIFRTTGLYSIEDWNRQLDKIRKRINHITVNIICSLGIFKGTAELSLTIATGSLSKAAMDLIGAERCCAGGQDGALRSGQKGL
jgi:MraZ protein